MANRSHPVRSRVIRWAIVIVILLGAIAFVSANAASLVGGVQGVEDASPVPLVAGLAISIAAIANRGGLSRAAHRATGLVAPRMSMVRPAAVGFNADKVI